MKMVIKKNIQYSLVLCCAHPRNSLSFDEVKAIYNGQIITKDISNRFYKSL